MRFYDPEFGEVLIDGVNVKDYNIRDLRSAMGLVMQEPTLFNYTLRENILYGKLKAKNEEIKEAAKIANASEFIESDELDDAFDDDAKSLRTAMEHELYSALIMAKLGEDSFNEKLKILKELEAKEEKAGTFRVEEDVFDKRTEDEKGPRSLHPGYNITAGNRGGKLSGG